MFEQFKALFGRKRPKPATTPEEDIRLAEAAFKANDLQHAAFHAGCALAHDPMRAEWRNLLERISDVAPDPLQLAPLAKENYFATVAVRAYLLERLNRLGEALEVLFQVVLTKPDASYLDWAIEWLQKAEHRGKVPEQPLIGFYTQLLQQLPALQSDLRSGEATLQRLPLLIRTVLTPSPWGEYLPFLSASLLRRLGEKDEALALARTAHAAAPSFETAVAVGSALQDLERPAEAIAVFREAERFRPQEESIWLSLADLYWETGDPREAARQYERVLGKEPEHPWALPSWWVVQHELTGADEWRQKLETFAASHPDNQRAAMLMRRFLPYFGSYLPDPSEAIINLTRDLAAAVEEGKELGLDDPFEITVNYLECPSALLSVERQLRALGLNVKPRLKVGKIAEPDPRRLKARLEYRLWTYRDSEATPVLTPPSPEVAEQVADLARTPYSFEGWRAQARDASGCLREYPVNDILAVMTHPPEAPDGMRWWTWIYRLQVAAAMVLAGREDSWEGSERRRVLLSLARGPVDWSVEAALLALAGIAPEDPAAEREIAALHVELLRQAPREGYVCYLNTLCYCALQRPHLAEEERAQWEGILDQL